MNYWEGVMDWPCDADWKCETCGEYHGLTWGLLHGRCQCNRCHTQYHMRDEDNKVVTRPISKLKPEYKKAAKLGWEKFQKPISVWTDEMWDQALSSFAGKDTNAKSSK